MHQGRAQCRTGIRSSGCPHLRKDWAHPAHISTRSRCCRNCPHLHRDCAAALAASVRSCPAHTCAGTALTASICTGTGLTHWPHLHRDLARPCTMTWWIRLHCTGTGAVPSKLRAGGLGSRAHCRPHLAAHHLGIGSELPHWHPGWMHKQPGPFHCSGMGSPRPGCAPRPGLPVPCTTCTAHPARVTSVLRHAYVAPPGTTRHRPKRL